MNVSNHFSPAVKLNLLERVEDSNIDKINIPRSSAGVFHENKSAVKTPLENPYVKITSTWVNLAAGLTNFICQALPKNKFSNLLASISYRSFLVLNGAVGALTAFKHRKLLNMIGCLSELPAACMPLSKMYAFRRFFTFAIITDDAVNRSSRSPKRPNNKAPYESFKDSFDVLLDSLKSLPRKLLNIDNWKDSENALMGFIGGLSSFASFASHLMGMDKLGTILGNLVGVPAFCIERLSLQNLQNGRFWTWSSGALLAGGAFFDLMKQPHLQIGFDTLSKIASQESRRLNEVNSKLTEVANPFTQPLKFIEDASLRIQSSFGKNKPR